MLEIIGGTGKGPAQVDTKLLLEEDEVPMYFDGQCIISRDGILVSALSDGLESPK
jgi:hypothetical protein